MNNTASYSFRLDINAKNKAQETYEHYGISLASAINAFLVKSIEAGGFPFKVAQGKAEPFETEEEADEFISAAVRRMLDEAR
ncbi:MAG: type II toxin-antitoxin system RelB/DinJ family antitoxin [Flexilinea sp.]|nr:type II toxin-antitoxin system RelB/DinJ family antitoxin [Flexilinea sp.]